MTIRSTAFGLRRTSNIRAALLGAAAVAALSTTAYAQTAARPAPATPAPAPAPDASKGSTDIVVTAQRRTERLQDVPIAITALSANTLQERGIQGSKELSQVTPGLNFTQSVYSPQPTIRGIGTRGVGAGDESVVPLYIDGVYQSFIPASDLDFNNIERIEVLKGPQGTLLGRNATGGAVNIITRQPTATPTGSFSVEYGSFNEVMGQGYISGGTDKLAASLAVLAKTTDGYIKDVVSGAHLAGGDDVSLRAKVLWRPTDRLDITFGASTSNATDSSGEAYQTINGNTIANKYSKNFVLPQTPYDTAQSYVPYNKSNQSSLSITAHLRLDAFTLTSVSGYQEDGLKVRSDSDGSILNIADNISSQSSDNFYQEVYATSNGHGPLRWIVGGVYYHDNSVRPQTTIQVSTAGAVSIASNASPVTTNSYAGYAQLDYNLTPAWMISAGGRYTSEDKSIDGNVILPTVLKFHESATFSKFTPSLTIKYQPVEDFNLFAKVGQAFKSGLYNASAVTIATVGPVKPETVTQYEIGAKYRPIQTLSLELSIYDTDYKNLQSNTRDPITLASELQNAGSAKIYGGEFQGTYRPIAGLSIYAGLSYLHGRYDYFPAAQVTTPIVSNGVLVGNNTIYIDAHGKTLIRAPSFTANLGGSYDIPISYGSLQFSANAYYEGRSYWDILNRLSQSPHTVVNSQLAWRSPDGHYSLALWGKNLLDKAYDLTVVTSATADTHIFAPPRSVGVRLGYDF